MDVRRRLSCLAGVALLLGGCAATAPEPVPVGKAPPSLPPAPAPAAPQRAEAPQPPPAPAPSPEPPRAPADAPDDLQPFERGLASWYGPRFHGRRTASGERFDKQAFTAAHRTLPFGTLVRVRHLQNGREVEVRINDRGPHRRDRVIDLSQAAAESLDLHLDGVEEVALYVTPEAAVQAEAARANTPAPRPRGKAPRRAR